VKLHPKIKERNKEEIMSELDEINAIIDDDSTHPEGAELNDAEKAELKKIAKEAYDDEGGSGE
jgi:hypothetical protein